MRQNLTGIWQFALDGDKTGIAREFYRRRALEDTILLPGTTAEAQKGERGGERRIDCLTEPYHFEGYAWYLREITIPEVEAGKRFFFGMERTRKSTVWVDGREAGHFESFYVEHRYELTGYLAPGTHILTVMIDNTDYVTNGGHMTSPDTQTNWNGIVGEIYLESTEQAAIERLRLYPSRQDKLVQIHMDISWGDMGAAEQGKTAPQRESREPGATGNRDALQALVTCRLTGLEQKPGRDYEHFEPTASQAAEVRRERTARGEEDDLPYVIRTLKQLPDRKYSMTEDTLSCRRAADADDGAYPGTENIVLIYPLGENAVEWDEYTPYVYELTVCLLRGEQTLCEKKSYFGLRDFTHRGLTLRCNDREIFLRGTHDGLIFPLTGYAPMDLASWVHVYGTAKEYGLNHYRCHTCCPPAAAFLAASYLGVYIEAELPFWGSLYDPGDESYNRAQQDFLLEEGLRTLDAFGDAPAFLAMSMGNELWGSREAIDEMMGRMKAHDRRHLYTQGSNNHQFVPAVLPNDDFFCGVRFSRDRLLRGSYAMCDAPLGFVQTTAPGAYWSYDEMIVPQRMEEKGADEGKIIQIQYGTGIKEVKTDGEGEVIPRVPVVSHEIGQYEFTPDFDEIAQYTGVLQPENMRIFRERMEEKGLLAYWQDYFAASGKLAADCYKLELEAALRSANLSGFQILDIKDFSGQGTALVGIFNALMRNKGIVTREKWRMSCSDAVLLPTLHSFVMESGSRFKCEVRLRYYRPGKLTGRWVEAVWYRRERGNRETQCWTEQTDRERQYRTEQAQGEAQYRKVSSQTMACADVTDRGLLTLGEMELAVPQCGGNEMFLLRFEFGEDIVNEYEIFVYNRAALETDRKEIGNLAEGADAPVLATNDNKAAIKACREGRSVVLFVKSCSVADGDTVQGDYCTDFWCYPMFRSISEGAGKPVPIGTMGLLIDSAHPALRDFATENYATAQWYPIVVHSRPMILENMAATRQLRPIVRMMDNFERNHNLGLIYEGRFHAGRLLVCHADLLTLKDEYPEAACLYHSLVKYAASGAFQPVNRLSAGE